MKKVAMLLAALFLGTLVSTPVYAETDADVWCKTNVGQDSELSVSVETNGKATDGVVVIGYDSSVVTCTEADVKIADSVDMYSVNVVDESVRISFLAEDAMRAGAIIEIAFETVDKNADKKTLESAVNFAGEAFNASGDSVVVKAIGECDSGNEGGDHSASVIPGDVSISQTPQPAKSAQTGDVAEPVYPVLLLAAGVILMIFAAVNTGRKFNR